MGTRKPSVGTIQQNLLRFFAAVGALVVRTPQMTRKACRLACAAFCLFGASSAHADVLVIATKGPIGKSIKQGQWLTNTTILQLSEWEEIWILDDEGTKRLIGPGSFALKGLINNRAGTRFTSRVESLGAVSRAIGLAVTARDTPMRFTPRRTRLAAVRSGFRPSVFDIPLGKPGRYCIPGAKPIRLVRPDRGPVTSYLVQAEGIADQKVNFAASQNAAAQLEFVGSKTNRFELVAPDGSSFHYEVFRGDFPLDGDPQDLVPTLLENGCVGTLAQAKFKFQVPVAVRSNERLAD